MNSKSKKKVKKNKDLDKHLKYIIDCDLNQTNDSKSDKLRSKLFQLNAIRDHFNSQKAFDDKRLELMSRLAEEVDRSDGRNTYLSEELIEFNARERTDRSFAQFDSHLYQLSKDEICQQLGLKSDTNDSDDCQMVCVVLKKAADIQIIDSKSDHKKTTNSLTDKKEEIYNFGQNPPKNNLLNKLGSLRNSSSNCLIICFIIILS